MSGLEQLANEIAAYGGSASVQFCRNAVLVYVGKPSSIVNNIVRQEGESLRIRDPKAPVGDKGDHSAERCFKVPLCIFESADAFGATLNDEICKVRNKHHSIR
jgi:hypothetical protein